MPLGSTAADENRTQIFLICIMSQGDRFAYRKIRKIMIICGLFTGQDKKMKNEKLQPIHPGEVLLEEFLKPMELSQNRLALDIRVPARRINEIVHGKRRITADTALRLSRYFGTSPQFWLGLQMDYDLDIATDKLADRLEKEVIEYAAPV
jgi:addiction module HigA family antidote